MRTLTLVVSLVGLIVFGGSLAMSVANPIAVERFARFIIKGEVEKRVNARIETLNESAIGRLAEGFLGRQRQELATVEQWIADRLPERLTDETARMLDADCECRKIIGQKIQDAFAGWTASLANANERLTSLIRSKYAEVAGLLVREFRIFTGANALVFALLGAVTLARPKANLHLILPALVLLGGAGLTAYFYIFQQNWLRTIIFSDYVGWWYFPWLAFAIGWLADIALNHGRMTVQAIEGTVGAIVDGLNVSPC